MIDRRRPGRPGTATRWPAAVLLAACFGLNGIGAAAAAQTPRPLTPAARLAALAQPVVQLVQIERQVTIVVPEGVSDKAAEKRLGDRLRSQQRRGLIARDVQAINRQYLDILAKNVDTYYRAGKTLSSTVKVTATCSGWFVTPTGYFVTAAHCVKTDDASTLASTAPGAMAGYIRRDYEESLQNFSDVPLDDSMRDDMKAIATSWYLRHSKLQKVTSSVSVQLAVQGQDFARDAKPVAARVISAGEPFPGRDVALLKVDGYDDLPSLPLGDDSQLQVGDVIYIDGFPGTLNRTEELSVVSRREPTFTEGPIGAFRSTVKGVSYLQTQAPAYHGNSGGPVFNTRGEVIGMLIAGVADPDTGAAVPGEAFALRRDGIAQELRQSRVTAVAGPTTLAFASALEDYDRGLFIRAKQKLQQLLLKTPYHPYAAKYINLSERQIVAGNDRTPHVSWVPITLGIAGVVVLALLVVIAVLIWLLRRGRPATGRPPDDPDTPPDGVAAQAPPALVSPAPDPLDPPT